MAGVFRRGRRLVLEAGAIILVALVAAMFWIGLGAREPGAIYPGVAVGPAGLGGLTGAEARLLLEDLALRKQAATVRLILENRSWNITLAELGATVELETALEQARRYGREGHLLSRWSQRWRARRHGVRLPVPYSIREDVAAGKIMELAVEVTLPPRDASLNIAGDDTVSVSPSVPGREVDMSAALAGVRKGILEERPEIRLEARDVPPRVETSQVEAMRVKGLMSAFTTDFNPANTNRVENILVAAAALHNRIILPGGTFSFNEVVGPRSTEAGYKEAIVIQDNEFRPGVGGGVCQVSTTLYNAALLANLSIAERHRHSLVIDYVPVGTDATVAYGTADLKLTNNTGGHLVLRTRVLNDKLTIKIFGDNERLPEVSIVSEIEKVIMPTEKQVADPTLPAGKVVVEQAGKKGYRTRVTRLVKQEGQVVKSELVSRDVYSPVPKVSRVGTGGLTGTAGPNQVQARDDQAAGEGGAGR